MPEDYRLSKLRLLKEALATLANVKQAGTMPELAGSAYLDEVALDFDACMPGEDLVEAGLVGQEAAQLLTALDEHLSRVSDDKMLWEEGQEHVAPEWHQAADLAKRALAILDRA